MSGRKPILNFILLEKRWTRLSPSWKEEMTYALQKSAEILNQDFSDLEVSLVLADDKEVQELNKAFRQKDKPTNVLSFPSDEEEELGDIILAYETVMKEAEDAGVPPLHHTLHLIVHGFLHLLGYDHENERDAHHMESMEVQILKALNIPNPYEDL